MPEYVALRVTGDALPVLVADPSQRKRDGRIYVTGQLVNERGVVIERGYEVERRCVRKTSRAVMLNGVLVPV